MRYPALLLSLVLAAPLLAMPLSVTAQQPSFDAFRRALVAAPDTAARQRLADAFAADARRAGAPLFENDSTVVFLYQGAADSVALLGDMTEWGAPLPFEHLPGTDLSFYRGTYPPEARLEYGLLIPGQPWLVPDAFNPHRVLNGFGPNSELAMPRYRHRRVFDPVRDGTPGGYERVERHELPAGALPYAHEVHVYRPPGYDAGAGDYPAVYFQDGRDYIEYAHVPRVLDALIAGGEIEPVVAVFVTPPNRNQPAMPNRMTEYGMNDDYVRFFADELTAFVDARYRTRRAPGARLVVGDSYGGLISTYLAFARPDVFGLAYSQSGYHSFQADRMIRALAAAERRPVRLYVDVGTYEHRVGVGLLPDAEVDFLAANRRLRDVLAAKAYDFVYREYPEGHTWGNWRAHLLDALPHFF